MVADQRLAEPCGVLHLLDGLRTLGEQHRDHQAVLVREHSQDRREQLRPLPFRKLRRREELNTQYISHTKTSINSHR
ncbi:hypothetical protein GCM10027168_26050 [Streptomyces capparidis]